MQNTWTKILNTYVNKLVSPDGRQTYESKEALVKLMLDTLKLEKSDTVMDIGSGWGNFTIKASEFLDTVIGIEVNRENLKEAQKRSAGKNIQYIQGSFEKLNYDKKVCKAVSMLAFHQVPWKDKAKALQNVADVLEKGGNFFLCDTMLLFNPENETELFNSVYRYLLKETTPDEIYKKYIAPYLDDNTIYTLADMKENSPEDAWFYSLEELQEWTEPSGLTLNNVIELCPFFGIVDFQKR